MSNIGLRKEVILVDEKTTRLYELIVSRSRLAYLEARRCRDKLFSKHDSFETEQRALVYLHRAARHMDLAYSLYQSYFEDIEHYRLTPIFEAFDIFYDEVTENFATDHSHQWSDIEFTRYRKTLYDWVPEAREDIEKEESR